MKGNPRALLTRNGLVPREYFNREIRASWKRCFDIGLDPFGTPKLARIGHLELERLREKNDLVRRLAKIEMGNLHRQIAGSNFTIIFANNEGIILDSIVDFSTSRKEGGRISPGYIWNEGNNGTNALGLVAAIRKPVIVHGDEHYFKEHAGLTCAGAPIYGLEGETVGIIDATSGCRSRQRHTLALVGMSCVTIEKGLFRARHKNNFVFEIHNRREFLGTLQSAMLALDERGFLVEASRQARFSLQGISLIGKIHFDEIFRTPFKEFLRRLQGGGTVDITDREGSSFAARACNYFARKETVRTAPARFPAQIKEEAIMVCEDPAVRSAMHMVKGAVKLNVPVLIRGETGTGKELMARYAHSISGRMGEFVPVNCAALPESLIESELFGYQDGSFTGAGKGGSKGLVMQARGGTLFLDEIGAMPARVQVKLLRFLDRMEIRPVGETREIRVDIQLISATNAKFTGVDSDGFRADLLYRLNTMEVRLPPLRERRDLEALFVSVAKRFGQAPVLAPKAIELLKAYNWPGNMRELKGILTRLLISCPNRKILADDVRSLLSLQNTEPTREQPKNLADHEREIILEAYERHQGNISAVSRDLGISRNKVYKKLKEARS
ncbi:MAG: sigma-54-dependent Fis family transcriptional regulator [Deltaproteobacteria bacterium]|nr:sigma-54-dependent Fis family transcriptional regulator [Deltaproteobacteria bacterium]